MTCDCEERARWQDKLEHYKGLKDRLHLEQEVLKTSREKSIEQADKMINYIQSKLAKTARPCDENPCDFKLKQMAELELKRLPSELAKHKADMAEWQAEKDRQILVLGGQAEATVNAVNAVRRDLDEFISDKNNI